MAPRGLADQPPTPAATAPGANYFGVGSSLIDEDELACINAGLVGFPHLTCLCDVGSCQSIYSDPFPLLLLRVEGLGCAVDQFPKRDRRMASPLSRAQQPMDHVFLRGSMPPKSRRPLPSTKRIDLNRFYAHRRT